MKRPKTVSGVHVSEAIREGAFDDWLLQLSVAIEARKKTVYGGTNDNPYAPRVQTERIAV